MKVYVYAICKNEEKFVARWVKSMSEADGIYVLDTGSTDNTVSLLRRFGANVEVKTIAPWRFDVARNASLEMVPSEADICVCTDLDEVFNSGWRNKLEQFWTKDTNRLRYRYTWSFNPDGSEGVVFWLDKIHSRQGYKWVHPVHEVLKYSSNTCKIVDGYGIQLNHFPDNEKPRSQYLPLLELSVQEEPQDDRNVHYLGREYMYHGMWQKSIETLSKHLKLDSATWVDERCASYRYISKCFSALGDNRSAENNLLKAIAEAPNLREPFIDLGMHYYSSQDWEGVIFAVKKALAITTRSNSYINEPTSWGSIPYDLMSIALYNMGLYEKSLSYAQAAAEISPENERLKSNFKLIKTKNEGLKIPNFR